MFRPRLRSTRRAYSVCAQSLMTPLMWSEADRLKPNSITLAGSKLVVDRFEAGQLPASNLSVTATSFEPASVMEFGFYWLHAKVTPKMFSEFSQLMPGSGCGVVYGRPM